MHNSSDRGRERKEGGTRKEEEGEEEEGEEEMLGEMIITLVLHSSSFNQFFPSM